MRVKVKEVPDKFFFTLLTFLVIVGLFILFSASQPAGVQRFQDGNHFIKRQLLFGFIPGVIFLFALIKQDLLVLKKITWLIYALSLVLLAMVFVPGIGVIINGSRSWINLFGFSFQPSEFAKLSIAMTLGLLLSSDRYDWSRWESGLLPTLAILSPTILLIGAQPDLGTLIIIVGEIFGVLVLANIPYKQLVVLALLGLTAVALLVAAAPYRAKRITVFLNPNQDPKGIGYQMNQAFVAAGSGGFWGLGLWNSRQKYQYLPEASADTIFAVLAEELGFIGSSIMVILILVMVYRGLRISKGCDDRYGSLLVGGVMIWFGWQSFLNIGATIGALPLTGVPLPFVSHGGSALLVSLVAAGMVLTISKYSKIS